MKSFRVEGYIYIYTYIYSTEDEPLPATKIELKNCGLNGRVN